METLLLSFKNGGLHVTPGREITIDEVSELKKSFESILTEHQAPLVLDLSGVGFIDSSGIGLLAALNTRMKNAGRLLVLRKPSPNVRKTLELVQLLPYFEIADSDEELIGLLQNV